MPSVRRSHRKSRRYGTAMLFRISVPFTPALGTRLLGSGWSLSKVASLLVVGTLAILLYLMSDSYAFFVYTAQIEGNNLLTAEQVYAASGAHEQSVFWLQPREIAARIEEHPYVKKADIHCRLPGRLSIDVSERSPLIVWISAAGERWIDTEGMTLPALSENRPPLLLVDDGGRAAQEDGTLQPAVAGSVLLLSKLMPEVTQFRYDATWGLLFQSEHGWSVALGDSSRMEYKVSVLSTTQNEILSRGEHPQLVDIRFPDSPYYR